LKEKKQGKSIKKRVLRALLYGILTLLSLPLVVAFLLKQPMVQSMAARKVAGWVSEKTGDSLTIGLLDIDFFKGIEIEKLDLRDSLGIPMMRISNLKVSPAFFELLSGKLFIHSVQMDSVDFRLIVHKGKDNYTFINFIKKLSSGDTTSSSGVFKLSIKKLSMANVHFQLKNENDVNPDAPKNTMNYTDINVSRASIRAHNFFLINDSLGFQLDNLTAHEKSGLFLRKMRSDVVISGRVFYFRNTLLETNHSRINLDYTMYASGWGAYSDFVDSVRLHGVFGPTDLDLSDIGYFANVMFKMKDRAGILGGQVDGPVSRLVGKNLDITYGKTTRFEGNISMAGLPDFYSTRIVAKIKNFKTSVSDLKKFVIPQDNPNIPIPESIANDEKFQLSGEFKGSYYNFATRASINTADSGKMNFDVNLKADTNKILRLKANFEATRFPLQHFVNSDSLLGNTDFTAHIAVLDTLGKQHTKLSVAIPLIQANGYNFKNINFQGRYVADTLFSKTKINDPHLIFHVSGYTVFKKRPRFHFNLRLIRSDFKPLKLWRQQDFHLSGISTIDFSGLDINTLTGHIRMENAMVGFGKDRYPVAHINIEKHRNISGYQRFNFSSDLLNFQMDGHYQLTTLGSEMGQFFNHYFPVLPKENTTDSTFNDSIQISFLLKKPEFIGEHFVYGLNISPNTSFTALLNLKNHTLSANGNAKKIIFNNMEALDNRLEISTKNRHLQMDYGIRHLILKDSTATDKTVFGLDSLRLRLGARNDSLDYRLFWHNADSVWINKGLVEGFYIDNRKVQQFNVSRSKVYINDTLWQVDPENKIIHSNDAWHFHHLVVRGGLSQFALQGEFPRNNGDSLSASFRSWNLSNLDLLWHFLGFDIDGTLNGIVKITHINGRNARVADLSIDSLALNHTLLGNARILSTWDNVNNSAFIKTQVVREGNAGRAKTVDLTGFYYPYRDSANLDLDLRFNRLKLKTINPFFNEYISDLRGIAEGNIKLRGSTGNPRILGYVDIKRASLIVNYLNTRYSFHQKILFDKDKIDFGKMTLYDTLGNSAILEGDILHHYFRDMRLNLTINTKKLLFFNTTRHLNDVYYGTAIASGKVKITGPANDIKMVIDAKTDAGTSVVLPLDYSTEIADKDYIIFKPPPVDSSLLKPEETVLKLKPEKKSAYAITLNMNIRPSADLKIYLPSNMGDIQSKGSGILNLKVNSDGNMTLTGDYVVNKGEFNFSLGSFVKKHFELVKGGRISWAGNPYQANVNIKGLYKLKANLSSLGIVVDSSADYKNRTQVNCYVIMSHDLFNPDIKFQIHFPDLDPDMRRMVYAQLDTTNTAVMNQQMISLLVLGSFSFSNASSISWNTSYYTILSNQLSGMLSKISKDFDIGVNYKPGDAITKQEFDVALSTQLFDDRLMINGNFGMTYDKQNKSANNLVGDVDIRYKLTKDGRWLLKAYNHSNDNSWYNYNNYDKVSPYTQGVGIVYRKEFTNLSDLFRRSGKKSKKKTNTKKGTAKNPKL
jgi:hypothetical protein